MYLSRFVYLDLLYLKSNFRGPDVNFYLVKKGQKKDVLIFFVFRLICFCIFVFLFFMGERVVNLIPLQKWAQQISVCP